jgi:SAM-dependent methyltransferase
MPSIETNRQNWDDANHWLQDGEEWSAAWGDTARLWFGTLMPRIAAFLPCDHLLEIACGHGRITARLLPECHRYTGTDLAPNCVAHCQRRFAGESKARFLVGDGKTLANIAPDSVDFAFSWDSLVHAEADAMQGYTTELQRVLRPNGIALLHHSNLGALRNADGQLTVANPHWRATSVDHAILRQWAEGAGLAVLSQELLQWGGATDSDCITLLQRPTADTPKRDPILWRHPDFNTELSHLRQLAERYRRR